MLDGDLDAAFAILRPPGHHAERDAAMGSCHVNNVAFAARWAQRGRGPERVMIVDWDVHIGNGAERIFWDRDERGARPLDPPERGWYPGGRRG